MSDLKCIFSSNASGRPYCRDEEEALMYRIKDNTCAVFNGSDLIFASESERFTKAKHDAVPPTQNLEMFKKYYPDQNQEDLVPVTWEKPNNTPLQIYECFYQSGFKEAAILVNYAFGSSEDSVTLAYMRAGQKPKILKQFPKDASLCRMYGDASARIFNVSNYAEGKFMGLAGFGKDNGHIYAEWDKENKEIVVHSERIRNECTVLRTQSDVMDSCDFAFTFQRDFEQVIVEVTKYFKELLVQNNIKTKNLCLSGGGVMNCPTNSKIVDLGLFENYYASPQPSDGCANSIGRFYAMMQNNGERIESKRLESAYLGVTYPHTDYPYKKECINKDRTNYLCNFLESGGVIAWFQDGAEYGPKSLGHRSFLADPTKPSIKEAMNKIKGRESWRPIAPIVPEELFHRIFEVNNTDMCEFMLRTLKVKKKWALKMGAVIHVDGTVLPQLLKREINPLLYDLIMSYFERTHIPCLINTSLNINGFPIVETPKDFGLLIEEIGFKKEIPDVKGVLTEGSNSFEVFPPIDADECIYSSIS